MALLKLLALGIISNGITYSVHATKTDGCTFSISTSGGISCPAGQLSDGQIRLNGSYPTAEFTIRGDKIWDAAGRGCIVTEAPITQVQCDLNKEPAPGFSIDNSNTLLYQGSSQFYACPATDTEYNVYIKPDFGQSKCFPVTLTASGCGVVTSSCSAPSPPSTITETTTCTITQSITLPGTASTITVLGSASITTETTTCTVTDLSTLISLQTVTSTAPCTSSSSSTTSKICHKCQATKSTSSTLTTTSSSHCGKCATGGGNYTTGGNSTWAAPHPTTTVSSQLY